ncbi:MAG: flagellar protein FlaG [Pseudomonas sp.]
MDMSARLNLYYPVTRAAEQVADKQIADKPVVRPTEFSENAQGRDPLKVQDADKVKDAVAEIEKFLKEAQRNLQFSTDEESGKIVVKVIASETGELIRQLPSEEALRIAHNLNDVNSILFDAKV